MELLNSQIKMVIVVAPDRYAKHARKLVHELSKLDNCQAAYWSIEQFKDNEHQISTHYVLFIGNDKENTFTKDYHSFISNKYSESGLCYGYDANRAFVYTDPEKFTEATLQVVKEKGTLEKAAALLSTILVPALFTSWMGKWVYESVQRQTQVMQVATLTAIDLFLEQGVGPWLNVERDAV